MQSISSYLMTAMWIFVFCCEFSTSFVTLLLCVCIQYICVCSRFQSKFSYTSSRVLQSGWFSLGENIEHYTVWCDLGSTDSSVGGRGMGKHCPRGHTLKYTLWTGLKKYFTIRIPGITENMTNLSDTLTICLTLKWPSFVTWLPVCSSPYIPDFLISLAYAHRD